jgi:predicted nucleotidyltransferase
MKSFCEEKMADVLSILRARKEGRRRLLAGELKKISKRLQEMGAQKIVVFGSVAEGCVRSSSDVDILAIMPPPMTGKQWMGKIYEEIDRQVDSDILAFTEEELAVALPVSRFLRHILDTGKVIFERRQKI